MAFGRRGLLVLHLADGREVSCPYPRHSVFVSGRRVQEDFHRVGQWWLAHRGPAWQPAYVSPPYPAAMPVADTAPRTVEEIWRTPPEARR